MEQDYANDGDFPAPWMFRFVLLLAGIAAGAWIGGGW